MSKRQVFTILLFVIALLLIMYFLWSLASSVAHNARLRGNLAMMRSHVHALNLYAENNDNRFPGTVEWPEVLIEHGYIDSSLIEFADVDSDQVVYQYFPFLGGIESDWILLFEEPDHWDVGVVVGFANNHVEIIEHGKFEQMLADQIAEEASHP
jgi:hypothetical protein